MQESVQRSQSERLKEDVLYNVTVTVHNVQNPLLTEMRGATYCKLVMKHGTNRASKLHHMPTRMTVSNQQKSKGPTQEILRSADNGLN